tara:strand:+ start:48 stop:401 length:354 start_codon:yes stop_codon:yes gene_type:complete
MSTFNFTGTIDTINETQVISETFSKREFVLTDNDENYPSFIAFELIKDNCNLLDNYKIGDKITVSFNLEGRKWLNPKTNIERTFNTLKVWKIEGQESAEPSLGVPKEASVQPSALPF